MSFPNISLADRIKKECLTNVTIKHLQENKLKVYENLKRIKLLKNFTKETSI